MIAAEALPYTTHPALVRRAEDERSSGRRGESRFLALAAGAAMAAAGAGTAYDAATKALPPAGPAYAAPFEVREPESARVTPSESVAAAPLGSYSAPAPVSAVASSPMPVAGDVLGPTPASQPLQASIMSTMGGGGTLTSFDGTMTMTGGGVQVDVQAQQPRYRQAAVREPVVWARPLNWVQTNDLGFSYSGARIR